MELNYILPFQYIIFLIAIMIISGIVKTYGFLSDIFIVLSRISSKRLQLFLVSLIGGILPIPGRVTVSASILDSMAKPGKSRKKFGIIDYLSSHHYYLWSPLEKTVILPMAVLSITYQEYFEYMWPVIVISFLFIFGYIFFIIKEEDIELKISTKKFSLKSFFLKAFPLFFGIILLGFGYSPALTFIPIAGYYILISNSSIKKIFKYINWKLVLLLFIILIVSLFIKEHFALFEQLLKNNHSLVYASFFSFTASWLMGSSGKYAGLASIIISIFGIHYLVWFLTIEFIAYNLSPTHKCIHIGRMYFNTPINDYFNVIILWQLLILIYAIVYTFVF